MSKLYFRYSSMNAGKSVEIIKIQHNYKEKNKNCVVLTSAIDDRYSVGKVTTRIGLQIDAIPIYKDTNIYDIFKDSNDIDCILVDESQFLTKEHVLDLCRLVDEKNVPVICYGLRSDYRGEPFLGSTYLLNYADTIEEVKTICSCSKKATMVVKYIDDSPIFNGQQIDIGGNDKYVSVCRKCYFKIKNNIK